MGGINWLGHGSGGTRHLYGLITLDGGTCVVDLGGTPHMTAHHTDTDITVFPEHTLTAVAPSYGRYSFMRWQDE